MTTAPVILAREAMRTRFEIVLCDDRDPVWLRAAAEEALDEISRVEADLSPYAPESMLAQINAEAGHRPVRVDEVTFAFLARAAALVPRLGGAFDPTVGPLMELLRAGDVDPQRWQAAHQRVGFARCVRLFPDDRTVSFSRPGVRLDPGAIGKGWALDRARARLQELGVGHGLLHGGTSSVVAWGLGRGGQPWRVALQDPLDAQARLADVVLRDQSLSVSAPSGRLFKRAGEPSGHVLDPRTGQAVERTLLGAVVTSSATDADAASTALLVLGAEGMVGLAPAWPGCSWLTVTRAAEQNVTVDVLGDAFGLYDG